jgi:hypothetical protein
MKASEIQRRILSLATEDFYGLWEIPSLVKDVFPQLNEQDVRELAETVLRELMDRHLIRLYRGMRFAGEERALAREESESALADANNWIIDASAEKENVRIAATEMGEREYYKFTQH